MKHLHLFAFAASTFTLLLSSCDKNNEQSCGGEDTERISAFPSMDAQKFAQYLTAEQLTYVRYQTYYYENMDNSGYSVFALQNKLNSVCPFEPMQLYTSLELIVPNADIKDSIVAVSSNNSFKQSVLPTNGYYEANEFFDTKDVSASSPFISHAAFIPYQGSRSADSAYFWTQVVSFGLGSKFKIQQ